MKTYFCKFCGKEFQSTHLRSQAYCSRSCEGKKHRERHGLHKLKDGRFCKQCGTHFFPTGQENNKQHCSLECAAKSARESRTRFWKKQRDPKTLMATYHARTRQKLGPDGNLKRLFRNNPNAPHACQSCGDRRVLDVAHKPHCSRNGAHRMTSNTRWPEQVWVLCPTCHALLDRMNYSPKDLGLDYTPLDNQTGVGKTINATASCATVPS
jgi:hypothetical protein